MSRRSAGDTTSSLSSTSSAIRRPENESEPEPEAGAFEPDARPMRPCRTPWTRPGVGGWVRRG
jgi:hypothetical protein